MMPGAGVSIGMVSVETTGPLPSIGSPSAFTTRPSSASPTGTLTTRPVRCTAVPSRISLLSERMATETVSSSRFCAMPKLPPSNSSSSPAMQPRSPYTRAIPSPTRMTVPVSTISMRSS